MEVSFITSAFKPEQFPATTKPEIAFAGRSNVGKSSLINRLVNSKKLARTSSRPGRTQSINFFSAGKDLHLVDLPGYGYAGVPLKIRQSWKGLIDSYLSERLNLKAVVVIMDIRRKPGPGDLDLLNWLKAFNIQAIIALTKSDKLSRSAAKRQIDLISKELFKESYGQPVIFSAKTGQGKAELWKRIEETAHVTT